MTRRGLLLVALQSRTPKNEVANRANEFNTAWSRWANAFNAMRPGSLDMTEAGCFEPLEDLLRAVRRARTAWIRGDRR